MGRSEDLAYWINTRDQIRARKESGQPPPWTGDWHMSNVRYCNVHREDDKVTKWIAKNWRTPNAKNPLLTLGMVAARMVNWPETLELIGFPEDDFAEWIDYAKVIIRAQARHGIKAWTSAYTISTCGRSMLKEDYVFDHVLPQVAQRKEFVAATLSGMFQLLTSVDGLGSFLAAQVIADLKNTPDHPLSRAPDFWSWSAPGPGSLRGLDAYFNGAFGGRRITTSMYSVAIDACYNEVVTKIDPSVGRIHMQDFQNCLCEFSKYIRIKEGDGRVRNSYSAGR